MPAPPAISMTSPLATTEPILQARDGIHAPGLGRRLEFKLRQHWAHLRRRKLEKQVPSSRVRKVAQQPEPRHFHLVRVSSGTVVLSEPVISQAHLNAIELWISNPQIGVGDMPPSATNINRLMRLCD